MVKRRRTTRRRNPAGHSASSPFDSLISYIGDRLRSGQPIHLPYGPTGLDDFARTEGIFLLRHQAQSMSKPGKTPQESALNLGKSKALAALADFLDAFNVRVEEPKPEQISGQKMLENSVDGSGKTPDKSPVGGQGPTIDG